MVKGNSKSKIYICAMIGFSAKYKSCLMIKLKAIQFKKDIFC